MGGCVINLNLSDSSARNLAVAGVVGLVVADAAGHFERPGDDRLAPRRSPPLIDLPKPRVEPDPGRTVSEQDCAAPIDPTLGNLKCR
jgi:hypothetical protein